VNKDHKLILGLVIFLFVISLLQVNTKNEESTGVVDSELKSQDQLIIESPPVPSVRYFSSSSNKIIISADKQDIYTDNPVTALTYYAVDGSNKPVNFREGDRAFVRIMGVSHFYNENTEIFHPELGGSKDYTVFSGDINIPDPGVYIIKVCLGPSINLNSEGVMVWPFGCFEDQNSVEVRVHE